MTKHPLTDEICYQIQDQDRLRELLPQDMRLAADWQLEQVILWLDGRYMGEDVLSVDIIKGLIEAMRPTQEDQEDEEDLKLVMERRNGPTTRLTLEELSMLSTQEDL